MGKAEENKRIKKNALLSHAFSLFMNKGIPNTTISDITEHAGVGKGTFYFYFRDKDDLIEKLIAQKAAQLLTHSLTESQKKEALSVEDSFVFIANDLIEQLMNDSMLLRFLNKNLNYGIYKNAMEREDVKEEFDLIAKFYEIIKKDGSEWNDPMLMLYTVVELVSSTCHSIILEQQPVDYEHYKPYLEACIRSIVAVFRK